MSHTLSSRKRKKQQDDASLSTDFKKARKGKKGSSLKKTSSRTDTAKQAADAGPRLVLGSRKTMAAGLPQKNKGDAAATATVVAAGPTPMQTGDRPPPTVWQVARRDLPAGQKVKLAPHVKVKNGKIARVAVGRMRTPSPFGAKMGDHTVAWTAVVDRVHALVFGRSLADAYTVLAAEQAHAEAWTADNESVGSRLWDSLPEDERNKRKPVLESYAGEVREALQGPPTPANLGKAIAHHLAYLNFLPYATVPAKGKIGSKGSGEGAARAAALLPDLREEARKQRGELSSTELAALVQREKVARDLAVANDLALAVEEDDPVKTKNRRDKEAAAAAAKEAGVLPNAREGMWKLVSLDAAVREARLDRVVAPDRHKEFVAKVAKTRDAAEAAIALSKQFAVSEEMVKIAVKKIAGRKGGTKAADRNRNARAERRKSTPSFTPAFGRARFNADLEKIRSDAASLGDMRNDGFQVLTDVQTNIARLTKNAEDAVGAATLRVGDTRAVLATAKLIEDDLAALRSLHADLDTNAAALEDEAALSLGNLLHEHQVTMARNYPVSVKDTGWLGGDAASAAVDRLGRFIQEKMFFENDAAVRLLGKIEGVHRTLGAIPVPAEANRWVGVARTADVVAAFPADDEVTVQGRAAAPSGVEGMGSHTTAWLTEVQVLERMVRESGKDGVTARLQAEVQDELEGDLMTRLAVLLPVEQLEAGQLGDIFDAALEVMEATTPEDAVTAYLSFRNLLPYATVDAGDRGGHGERRDGALMDVFDAASLNDAIREKLDELKPAHLGDTAGLLRETAEVLRETLAATKPPAAAVAGQPVTALDVNGAPVTAVYPVLPADPVTPSWHTHARLKAAVDRTVTALEAGADGLDTAKTAGGVDTARIGQDIYDVRLGEHTRVFRFARGL